MKTSTQGLWRPGQGTLFEDFRANAPHFWSWIRSIQLELPAKQLFSQKGVGVADAHILNFGDIPLADGTRKMGLIDLDDGGSELPLAADFLRLVVGNQISVYQVPIKSLIQAYSEGLKGRHGFKPSFFREIESTSAKDWEKRQKKYHAKMISGDRFSDESKLLPLEEAPENIKKRAQELVLSIQSLLPKSQVLDLKYKIKNTGGSQGALRVWLLTSESNQRHIIELKELLPEASLEFAASTNPSRRFEDLQSRYRPQGPALGIYKIINLRDGSFLARERFDNYVKFEPDQPESEIERMQGQEFSLFIANFLGTRHGEQASGEYHKLIESDQGRHDLMLLSNQYVEIIKTLHGGRQP